MLAHLAFGIASSAFLTPPTLPLLAPTAHRSPASVRLSLDEERIESGKACVIASISGTFASAPVKASALLATNALTKATALAEWEFSVGTLAVELALFGVVYRCVVRNDDNDMLRQGAVGAFALCRALSSMQVSTSSNPDVWLHDVSTMARFGIYFGESALAFGLAAWALEFAWNKGWARRLPGIGLPQYYSYYETPPPYFRDDDMPPQYYRDAQPLDYRGEPPRYFREDSVIR